MSFNRKYCLYHVKYTICLILSAICIPIYTQTDIDSQIYDDNTSEKSIDHTTASESSDKQDSSYSDTILYSPAVLNLIQKGDNYFEQRYYEKANKCYIEALEDTEQDIYIILKIADAYNMNQQYIEAERYYSKALNNKSYRHPLPYLQYAEVLMKNKKYNQAQKWFEYFNNITNHSDPIADRFISSIENLNSFVKDSMYISIKSLEINSPESDFSPAVYKNGIVFVSSRKVGSNEIGKIYYDLYFSEYSDSTFINPHRLGNHLNSRFHEGPLVFYQDYKQLLLTRSNPEKANTKANNTINLSIYKSGINDLNSKLPDFGKIVVENFNYNMAHPAITSNGQEMYFVSNAPNGYGNTDIYKTSYNDGVWSTPVNLGKHINTSRNEMFLYLSNDTLLFFASDGHGGLGGLDIFSVNLNEKRAQPINLGYPINSNKDDFGLIYTENNKKGFFSSNRPGGKGSDDIYSFEFRKIKFRPIFKSKETGELVDINSIEIRDVETNKLISKNNSSNSVEFDLLSDRKYLITVNGETIENDSQLIAIDNNLISNYQHPVEFTIELKNKTIEEIGIKQSIESVVNKPNNGINVKFRVQIAASRKPLSNNQLKIKYEGNRSVQAFKEEGWHKYIIGEFDSYYDAREVLLACGVKDAFIAAYENNEEKLGLKHAIIQKYVMQYADNKIQQKKEDNYTIYNHFKINFDHDRAIIKNEVKIILDSVIQIMKQNSKLKVEISGHTDIIGAFDYNMALSRERTNKVNDYIVNNGIANERIETYSFGESKLLKVSNDDSPDEIHMLNRRVEVVLYDPKE